MSCDIPSNFIFTNSANEIGLTKINVDNSLSYCHQVGDNLVSPCNAIPKTINYGSS